MRADGQARSKIGGQTGRWPDGQGFSQISGHAHGHAHAHWAIFALLPIGDARVALVSAAARTRVSHVSSPMSGIPIDHAAIRIS